MAQDQSSDRDDAPRKWVNLVSWTALAFAILIAALVVRERVGLDDLLPGRDAAGLPAPGATAPDIAAVNADGALISLSDFQGQPVWLNFWGAWCPPCRAEIPDMIRAYDAAKERGVVLVAVSLDEPSEEAFDYATKVGMDFIVLSDPNRAAIEGKYRVRTFPTHIFIDRDGVVREVVLTTMSTGTALNKVESIT